MQVSRYFHARAPPAPWLTSLGLANNKIGDKGLEALSAAFATGAMASLETLYVDDGQLGTEHPALKAACEARAIDLA